MKRWFGGKSAYTAVNGTDTDDHIEVDQISFTSSCSSGDNEHYVTARTGEELQTDLLRFDEDLEEEDDFRVPGTSENSITSEVGELDSDIRESEEDQEVYNESILVRNSIFWFNDDEVDKSKLKLPTSSRGRVCRLENEVDDNHLETLCRSLQITIGLNERSRWLNTISRDPVLSALARELDEEFPIAMLSETETSSFGISTAEDSESGIGIQRKYTSSISTSSSIAGSFQTTACIPSSSDLGRPIDSRIVRTVVPARKGIEAVEIRRKVNETCSAICSAIIRKSLSVDPPRDRRVAAWMNRFADADTWIPEITPASRNHDKYAADVPPLSEDWVLHLHKQPTIRAGIELQHAKCANCRQSLSGINLNDKEVAPRFCEYYGLYFCTLCHGNDRTIIPSRILCAWNFNEFPVSDRAFRFLRAVRELPVFGLRKLAMELIKKNRPLRNVIDLRRKLKHMEQFIKTCPIASAQITDFGNLGTMFASLDRYLLETDDTFSLNDLLRVHNKDLGNLLEPLAKQSRLHILKCRRCHDQSHVCVKCNDMTDRLFPFEDNVTRCDACGALSHSPKCPRRDVPRDSACPKCIRIQKTRSRQRILAVGTIGEI